MWIKNSFEKKRNELFSFAYTIIVYKLFKLHLKMLQSYTRPFNYATADVNIWLILFFFLTIPYASDFNEIPLIQVDFLCVSDCSCWIADIEIILLTFVYRFDFFAFNPWMKVGSVSTFRLSKQLSFTFLWLAFKCLAEIRMRHKTKYLLKLISIPNVNGASYNDLKASVFFLWRKKKIHRQFKKKTHKKFLGQTLSIVNKKMVYKRLNFQYEKK